uniref:DUF7771 domain-containing protein n=2 Tax=Oryza brachyantha TaxID=4533 RepID=J3MSB6_ORYBR
MAGGTTLVVIVAVAVLGVEPVAAGVAPTRWGVPPGQALDTYEVRMVNRMGRDMEFECDGWPHDFTLKANGGDMNVTYETAFDRPGYNFLNPRVACLWSYAGNYMSSVMIWDEENWPEKKACLTGPGGGCLLLFENKEEVVVTPAGARRVLGDLAVKECSTHWYGKLLPWGAGCSYPKHDHAYAGTVHSTWSAAAMGSMIGH